MTVMTLVPSASLPYTTRSASRPSIDAGQLPRTATTQQRVVFAQFSGDIDTLPVPPGFDDIDDVVARHERDPQRRVAIEAGNKVIAERYYKNARGLAALRLRRGWSQRALADAIGVKQPHIARLETGQNDPSLGTMRKLAAALDVTIEDIVRALDSTQGR